LVFFVCSSPNPAIETFPCEVSVHFSDAIFSVSSRLVQRQPLPCRRRVPLSGHQYPSDVGRYTRVPPIAQCAYDCSTKDRIQTQIKNPIRFLIRCPGSFGRSRATSAAASSSSKKCP